MVCFIYSFHRSKPKIKSSEINEICVLFLFSGVLSPCNSLVSFKLFFRAFFFVLLPPFLSIGSACSVMNKIFNIIFVAYVAGYLAQIKCVSRFRLFFVCMRIIL